MTLKYKGKEYEIKYSIRAMLMYENVKQEKEFNSLTDVVTLFYCFFVCCTKDYSLSFDEFLEWVDDNPDSIILFDEWAQKVTLNNNKLKKD